MRHFPREAYRPLTPYAPDRRPIEVDLSDNTNRWGAHPGAMQAVKRADEEALLRYPTVYADGVREAVARRYGVPADAVATGCGSDDLLDSAFRAAGEPGDAIAFLPPTFSMVEVFARMNGMVPRAVVPVASPGDGLPEPERFLDGDPALVYLCRPNNPTGESAPREWVERLITAIGERGPVLLLDEAYADFAADGFLSQAATSPRTVVLRTLSKVFGLAGLRVGFAVGAPEVIREIEKSRGPYKVNRLAEAAAVAALDDAEGWVPEIVQAVGEGRAALTEGLRARGLAPLPSNANFVLVPIPPDGWRSEREGTALGVTMGLRDAGVAVRPFPALPGIGDAVRISVGPSHEIEALFAALDGLR